MADTKPDKPGFLSRLFGRKAETPSPAPAQDIPQAGGQPEAMPSPPATAADDLVAARHDVIVPVGVDGHSHFVRSVPDGRHAGPPRPRL